MSSADVLDPNTLTVDRLRKELTDRNVPLPKYSKKDTLVELYKQHIVFSRAPKSAAGNRLEFSDDDDAVGEVSKSRKSVDTMSKRRSVGTKGRDVVIITSSGINISRMSDGELVEYLQEKGADVGPVTDTTRGVYEKKLLKLLEGSVRRDRAPAAPRISPLKSRAQEQQSRALEQQRKPLTQFSDEEEEEAEEEDEEQDLDMESGGDNFEESYQSNRYNSKGYDESLTAHKQYTTSEESYDPFSYRRSVDSAIRQPLSSFGGDAFLSRPQLSGFTSTTTRRSQMYTSSEYATPRPGHYSRDGPSSLSSAGQLKAGTTKRSGFCFWLLVLLLLIGLIVIVVVIWNMDPAFRNPARPAISKSTDE